MRYSTHLLPIIALVSSTVLAQDPGPSPTASIGCEPHGDHWFVPIYYIARVCLTAHLYTGTATAQPQPLSPRSHQQQARIRFLPLPLPHPQCPALPSQLAASRMATTGTAIAQPRQAARTERLPPLRLLRPQCLVPPSRLAANRMGITGIVMDQLRRLVLLRAPGVKRAVLGLWGCMLRCLLGCRLLLLF